MKCPFCAEEIKDEASVCKHCRRDLTIVRPVFEALRAQAEDISDLRRDLDALGGARPAVQPGWGISAAPLPVLAAVAFAVPFVGLVFAHYLIVMAFDWPVLVLRIVSIAIPMGFAILTPGLKRLGWAGLIALAACLGAVAVLAMSWVVGTHDHVPVIPASAREWREAAEYATSIALGLVTGVLVAQAVRSLHAAAAQLSNADLQSGDMRGHVSRAFPHLELLSTIFTVAMPVFTGLAAVYTGIRSLLF